MNTRRRAKRWFPADRVHDRATVEPSFGLDAELPALIVKIGRYPWHHGGVGAIRSLGRLGVPVYAVTEDRWTPAAVSRYLKGYFVWPTTGSENPERLVQEILRIGRRIGRPSVLIPTDDVAAILIAEHAAALRDYFLFPTVAPHLPRQLASKSGLHQLCLREGVPTPKTFLLNDRDSVERAAQDCRFPMVAKNGEAFARDRAPIVGSAARFEDGGQLRAAAEGWGADFSVILQEYLPVESCEDWIVHAYCDESSDPLVHFTGLKFRSSPPEAGMTSCGFSVVNDELAVLSARFVKNVGFRGTLDLDWRYDRRTGDYYLLDFNPRLGAQFRLFENSAGIDVVRAMHLHLAERTVPLADQVDGRRYLVENLDLASVMTRPPTKSSNTVVRRTSTELAWLARDDMRPAIALAARLLLRGRW